MRTDLDFRFAIPPGTGNGTGGLPVSADGSSGTSLPRFYTTFDVERIVQQYFRLLAEYLDADDHEWTAYVMEKPRPIECRGKIKDGLHIMFPNLIVQPALQHLIRKRLLDESADMLFKSMPLCNSHEDIIDEAIIDRNNWQMYGSRKPNCEAYRVTKAFSYDRSLDKLTALPMLTPVENLELVDTLSVRKSAAETAFLQGKKAEMEEFTRHVLSSVDARRKDKLHTQIFSKTANNTRNHSHEEERKLARELVIECMKPERAECYEDWIKIGWCLRNIDVDLIDTWIEFSKVGSKYIEGECADLWWKMRIDAMGMGTLRWWARQDNPTQYEKIIDGNVLTLLDKCVGSSGAHFDVAKVVHAMFKDRYRFTIKDIWFTYDENRHKWVRSREGLKLKLILSNDVCSKFLTRATHWNIEAMRNEEQRDVFEDRFQKLSNVARKLKDSGFKESIMKECKCLFTDEKFEELLDSNPHLIGFENGVYDLRLHEFRDGLPDDYISFGTGLHYFPYNAVSQDAKDIERFLGQVYTSNGVKQYIKDVFATAIDGGIRVERFYVFTGNGCHAKDTEIMMYDGHKKLVQDVVMGDKLMGDDSGPRVVQELFRGKADMYRISPVKGDSFVVNGSHVMSLKFTNLTTVIKRTDSKSLKYRAKWWERNDNDHQKHGEPVSRSRTVGSIKEARQVIATMLETNMNIIKPGDVVDVKLCDLLHWKPWWWKKTNVCLYRPQSVDFPNPKPVSLDPYMLGYWLGDGSSRDSEIVTMEPDVVDYFESHLQADHVLAQRKKRKINDKASTYAISFSGKRKRYTSQNEFRNSMREYDIQNNKHIPYDYLTNTREVRLAVLAGIIDSDGHYQRKMNQYEITLKSEKLMNGVVDLCRSLGFACYKQAVKKTCCNNGVVGDYFCIQIVGKGMEDIPTLVPRNKAAPRTTHNNVTMVSFDISRVEDGDYYGFELDGNHRYLMGDFTVTHNSNGKSRVLELFQKSIGEYYCILPISLLTQKRCASNSAQSELERTRGRRLAVMQEPSESEKLNIGLMKELTGGDRILARGLFKEPVEFRPQFKMILVCNDRPEVPSDDGGTWRRIRVVQHTSKFVERPDASNKFEFPMDCEITEKFDRWKETFISMLIDHHKNMDAKNIVEPAEVRIATDSYKLDNDLIGQFCSECIVKDEGSTTRYKLIPLYGEFKEWCQLSVQKGRKLPDRSQFRSYIEKMYDMYPSDGRGWKGFRLRSVRAVDPKDADSDGDE